MESERVTNDLIKKAYCCAKPPDFLGGILFVVFGIILLLNNFDIIPWSIWRVLASFWPVILILIGLDMISGTSWIIKIITTSVGIAIIAFFLTYSLSEINNRFKETMYLRYPILEKIFQKFPGSNKLNPGLKFEEYFENSTTRI